MPSSQWLETERQSAIATKFHSPIEPRRTGILLKGMEDGWHLSRWHHKAARAEPAADVSGQPELGGGSDACMRSSLKKYPGRCGRSVDSSLMGMMMKCTCIESAGILVSRSSKGYWL